MIADFNSGWSVSASGRMSPGALAAQGRVIIAELKKRGLRVPPSNRLERAIQIVERLNDPSVLAEATEEELKRGREAFRTLWEAFVICYAAWERKRDSHPIPLERLSCLLRGSDEADTDSNTAARNEQFELYVAASLLLGGAEVLPGEPDFRLLYHGEHAGLAVKRVRSLKVATLRDALRDAASQIAKSAEHGIIILNLDSWLAEPRQGVTLCYSERASTNS